MAHTHTLPYGATRQTHLHSHRPLHPIEHSLLVATIPCNHHDSTDYTQPHHAVRFSPVTCNYYPCTDTQHRSVQHGLCPRSALPPPRSLSSLGLDLRASTDCPRRIHLWRCRRCQGQCEHGERKDVRSSSEAARRARPSDASPAKSIGRVGVLAADPARYYYPTHSYRPALCHIRAMSSEYRVEPPRPPGMAIARSILLATCLGIRWIRCSGRSTHHDARDQPPDRIVLPSPFPRLSMSIKL